MIFSGTRVVDLEAAREICRGCEVRESCLRDAVKYEEEYGVYGGQLLYRGKIVTSIELAVNVGRQPKSAPRPPAFFIDLTLLPEWVTIAMTRTKVPSGGLAAARAFLDREEARLRKAGKWREVRLSADQIRYRRNRAKAIATNAKVHG